MVLAEPHRRRPATARMPGTHAPVRRNERPQANHGNRSACRCQTATNNQRQAPPTSSPNTSPVAHRSCHHVDHRHSGRCPTRLTDGSPAQCQPNPSAGFRPHSCPRGVDFQPIRWPDPRDRGARRRICACRATSHSAGYHLHRRPNRGSPRCRSTRRSGIGPGAGRRSPRPDGHRRSTTGPGRSGSTCRRAGRHRYVDALAQPPRTALENRPKRKSRASNTSWPVRWPTKTPLKSAKMGSRKPCRP